MTIITRWMRNVQPQPEPAPVRKEAAAPPPPRRSIDEQILHNRDWERSQRMMMGARLR